ncbi:Sperm-associated antigen 5 [Gossypium arboreum]|uniref:Sperm-associated antigen 5 n=1 Tax=Gossypium arboreum TaxID=29729 RepID=A0A0B0NG65_GOSAR|nr:Sperm-associated antigen 5 [Gossypium arboreum]
MRASVRPCLEHGIDNVMRASVRPCLGHGFSIDMCASVRPCLGHGIGHIMRANVNPCLGHGICSYSIFMRYGSSYVTLMFCQASIGDQETSEASITLSPDSFGIASLNVLIVACIGT